jgi:hypothetical protein
MAKWTDIVFLLYFASHIPITLLIDAQCALPKWLYPETVSLRATKEVKKKNACYMMGGWNNPRCIDIGFS